MRLVEIIDGAVELRWTWLPYWLAANPKLRAELELELQAAVRRGEVTTDPRDLDQLHFRACQLIQDRFPGFTGLAEFLRRLQDVQSS